MLLEMRHITKYYGALRANDDVSFGLNKGEILAIAGENGAGKSTIMKILYGLERADAGGIWLDGREVQIDSPIKAIENGIGMLQQHFMLFQSMTIAENIVYGAEARKNKLFFDREKTIGVVSALSESYGMKVDPNAVISECPVGVQQRVEILKILYQNAGIIIFDEPSAVLTPPEVKDLLKTIKKLAQAGKSIILITHKLQEIMEVADRVVVMRRGRVVGECMRKDTSVEQLSMMMIGRQLQPKNIPPVDDRGDCLRVEHLGKQTPDGKKVLDDVTIHVQYGEIVGIAGVSGNGQSDLVNCLFGFEKPDEGSVRIAGENLTGAAVARYRANKVALIPEDRYLTGSAKAATLTENILMGNEDHSDFCQHGIIRWNRVRDFSKRILQQFGVACSGTEQRIGELSGGNAQKVIVAREMTRDVSFFIAHEPTRGIDIGAIEFIHNKLLEKRIQGAGVLLISSELTEIMQLSDRIYVIHNGKINSEFRRGTVDETELGLRMLGGK